MSEGRQALGAKEFFDRNGEMGTDVQETLRD